MEASPGKTPDRCASESRMKMNPLMKRRNVEGVVKTRGVSSLWDKLARCLMTGRAAAGVEGA